AALLPALLPLLPSMKTIEHVVVNGAFDSAAAGSVSGVTFHDYAQLVDGRADTYPWPLVDESQAAAMCYTSGTTADPKGVVYSHRSIYLHAMAIATPDMFDLASTDLVLAVVPQFHVLAWGLPYAAFAMGTSLALPDRCLPPEPLARFIAAARPNKAAG